MNSSFSQSEQMELGLAGGNQRGPGMVRRDQPRSRARWWFAQMRQVVERAVDFEPAPRFQLEQTLLPGGFQPQPGDERN